MARVRDLRRRLVERALGELDSDEDGPAPQQHRDDPYRGAVHPTTLRRKNSATSSASAANPAQTKKAEREARVIVASIAPSRSSRADASAESCCAPCLSNGSARSGVSPSFALPKAERRSSATGTFLSSPIGASSSTAVPRSSALSPAAGTFEASNGDNPASASA